VGSSEQLVIIRQKIVVEPADDSLFSFMNEPATANTATTAVSAEVDSYITCTSTRPTLSVLGVGVRLAVCLKGAKVEKSLFGGLRNQHAPKT